MIKTYLQNTYQTCYDSLKDSLASPSSKPVPIILATVSGSLGAVLLWRSWRNRNRKLPPSPSGWPLIGNVLELSDDKPHDDFIRLQKKYNLPDVFTVRVGPSYKFIVLNSHAVIKDAFVTQGELFAARPVSTAAEVMELKDEIFTKDYFDPTWNEGKAFIMSALRSAGFGTTKGSEEKMLEQIESLAVYLKPYVKDGTPVDLRQLLPLVTANVIFHMLFNKVYNFDDEELQVRVDHVRDIFKSFNETFFMELVSPWITKVFMRGTIRKVFQQLEKIRAFIREEIKSHQETMDPDNPRDFLDIYLTKKKGPVDFDILTNTAFSFLPDAIDSIGGVLTWIALFLGHYRDRQKKIYEEIETVTSGNRNITWSDRPKLPYTEAFIREVYRVACIATVTPPHTVKQDTYYQGYFIPKGVPVIANLYAAMRDPVNFPQPETFDPERFFDADGKILKADTWVPFSMGRRKCLGEPLTNMEVFLFATNLVQRYEFTFPEDEPKPSMEPMDGLLVRTPHPFKVILKSRT